MVKKLSSYGKKFILAYQSTKREAIKFIAPLRLLSMTKIAARLSKKVQAININLSKMRLDSESDEPDSDSETDVEIAKKALCVDPADVEGYDGTSEPQNGSQYLLKVMEEMKLTPKIVVADASQVKIQCQGESLFKKYLSQSDQDVKINTLLSSSGDGKMQFIPSKLWQNERLSEFSQLRSKVERWRLSTESGKMKISTQKTPEIGNEELWLRYCFGTKIADLLINNKFQINQTYLCAHEYLQDFFSDMCTDPSVSILNLLDEDSESFSEATTDTNKNLAAKPISLSSMLSISQRKIEYLITCHLKWLNNYGFFNHYQGKWIWALLVSIQKPLEPTTESDLRYICKFFIQFKHNFLTTANKGKKLSENDAMKDNVSAAVLETLDEEQLTDFMSTVNLFIYLIGSYFDQRDLISVV